MLPFSMIGEIGDEHIRQSRPKVLQCQLARVRRSLVAIAVKGLRCNQFLQNIFFRNRIVSKESYDLLVSTEADAEYEPS
jgi:hypothetical protein